jgi:hypothetical protein
MSDYSPKFEAALSHITTDVDAVTAPQVICCGHIGLPIKTPIFARGLKRHALNANQC